MREILAATSNGAFKLAFGALVIAAAIGATYSGSGGNFSMTELRAVLALGMAISGVLMLGALTILRHENAVNAVLALITFGSVFTTYITIGAS